VVGQVPTIQESTIHGGTIHGGTIHGGTIHGGTIHGGTIHEGQGSLGGVRILAVSDEVDERLRTDEVRQMAPDLIVSCGDVPFELLSTLAEASGVPLVFVPGNHDPDLSGYRPTGDGLVVQAGFVTAAPWPAGTINTDGRLTAAAGVTLAGLGGCRRYRDGPNQYSERQQARRVRHLVRRARWQRWRHRPSVDLILTHAGPRGLGDGDDAPHRGFEAWFPLVEALKPRLLLHGHFSPTLDQPDHWIGRTRVVNVFNHRLLDLPELDRPAVTGDRTDLSEVSGADPGER
jgi:hypothetical protein